MFQLVSWINVFSMINQSLRGNLSSRIWKTRKRIKLDVVKEDKEAEWAKLKPKEKTKGRRPDL